MKKKKVLIVTAALLVAAGAAGAAGFCLYHQNENRQEVPRLPEGMSFAGDVVSATGLTGVGMLEENWELGFLADGLYVEEAYLNIGDKVQAHTPVFSVSQDSLEAARRELEKEVQETQLNRRQGEITFETGMVDAQKEKDLAAADASYAQAVYDNAVKSEQDEVDSLQEQVDDAQEQVDEYTASIEADYYYTYYKVGELEATWKDQAAFLMELYENWDVDSLESVFGGSGGKNGIGYVTNQISQASSSDNEMGAGGKSVNAGDNEIKYNIYLAMVEEVEESEAAYEAALESYETARAKAAAGMEQAKSELAVLKAQLEEQKLTCEQALIEAKREYDLAVSNHENAQMVYDSAVKQLEEELETLKEAEETAAENLALFEESIGDGTFYTGAQGTVVMNNVRSRSWLTEDTVILAYSNPETVSVAAGVDQTDIASISIEDEAYVVISGYGSFTGKVTSLNPVSSSGGSSSVTYTVNIVLEGDISTLESNLTAYAYFGLTEEEKEQLSSSRQGGGQQDADGEGNGGFEDNRSGMQGGGPQ